MKFCRKIQAHRTETGCSGRGCPVVFQVLLEVWLKRIHLPLLLLQYYQMSPPCPRALIQLASLHPRTVHEAPPTRATFRKALSVLPQIPPEPSPCQPTKNQHTLHIVAITQTMNQSISNGTSNPKKLQNPVRPKFQKKQAITKTKNDLKIPTMPYTC